MAVVRVRVLFFGPVKDIAGMAEDTAEVAAGSTLRSVFALYALRFPKLAAMESSLAWARNQRFCRPDEPLSDGDEVAFLPPVSGGSGGYLREIYDSRTGSFFALTEDPIDMRALAARVLRPEDGAVVHFEGVVRNNSNGRPTLHLDYECYLDMAIEALAALGRDIARSYAVGNIAIVHRLGRMRVGETSVGIVVTAPHRQPAFEAALEAINRLKRSVPIWKKEHFADGEEWVEGEWDESVRLR